MKQGLFEITENTRIARDIYRMNLVGDTSDITAPGQFVNIRLDGLFLRRPISVCDVEGGRLTIIYKVVGKGTEQMSKMSGGSLDLLTGLGNGYDLSVSGDRPLLIGGGVGAPPMYLLCRRLVEMGKRVTVLLGFQSKEDVFLTSELAALGAEVKVATNDGTLGTKGFVTNILPDNYSYYYACGPEPMLRAVYKACKTPGQLSFEERMGCGFGACMGCSCKTVTGYKRICRDGPVLRTEEILWED